MLISSKYIEMINFHELLDLFINIHEAITDERKDRKYRIMNNVKPL